MRVTNKKYAIAAAILDPYWRWYFYLLQPHEWGFPLIEREFPDDLIIAGWVRVAKYDPEVNLAQDVLDIPRNTPRLKWEQFKALMDAIPRPPKFIFYHVAPFYPD